MAPLFRPNSINSDAPAHGVTSSSNPPANFTPKRDFFLFISSITSWVIVYLNLTHI
jgi:hypothetical protein